MKSEHASCGWRRPEVALLLMAAAVPVSFDTWQALLNNFAIERAAFTGAEIGILQSLREIPGFLAFAVVFLLLVLREQTLAYVSLALLGIGTAITGWFPSVLGLYLTTVLMSTGFHYYHTVQESLSLQWFSKERTPVVLGRMIAVGSFTSIATFGLIWLAFEHLALDFRWVYLIGGGLTVALAIFVKLTFPHFPARVEQRKHIVLRSRYWLFYALTFMSGARRQIFIVFAGFLMVEKFGFDVGAITALFLVNALINVFLAPKIGHFVARFGDRNALVLEYIGLIGVFSGYAFVEHAGLAADTLRGGPPVLRAGHRHKHLLSENRRPRRYRLHRRCVLYHQSHCGGRLACGLWLLMAGLTPRSVLVRRGDGQRLLAARAQRATLPPTGK